MSCENEGVAWNLDAIQNVLLFSSLDFVTQRFPFKVFSTWFTSILWIGSVALYGQGAADLRAEVGARRIEYASQQVARIKAMVDAGLEARIRLDAAERDWEDTKDQVILESAASLPLSNAAPPGTSDDAIVAAAQRRLNRLKAWSNKMRELNDNGIPPPPDLIVKETELHNRESDLASAQSRIFAKVEAASMAERSSHKDETIPLDFGEMEHFEGGGTFDEDRELQAIVKAFETEFDRPLPISADGQTEVHRALGFDHRGRVDVGVDPRAPEGIWLRRYLRSRKIPYYAFTSAVAGKSTAAHIHIGPGSSRLQRPAGKA